MKVSCVLALQALTWLATALPPPTYQASAVKADWDVIVVGGGPAGLSAASALGRVRRKALVIDSADYRNQVTRRMHDVIGYDGVTPAYFRWRARQQIAEYNTVHLTNGTVNKIEKTGSQANSTFFTVTSHYDNGTTSVVTARKIILATGLHDIIPSTPGLKENFGKGIFWCPWCDGYEHADQPLGVLGPLSKSGDTPLEILSLNKDVILFVNGTNTAEERAIVDKKLPGWEQWLKLHNISIENRTIASLERLQDGANFEKDPSKATHPEHDLFQVHFDHGPSTNRSAFLTNFPNEQKTKLGEETGVFLYGGKLATNITQGMMSNVPGIYTVGDCNSDNSTNVPHAMWTGKRAVVSLHVKIEMENALRDISSSSSSSSSSSVTRRTVLSERAVWDQVNGPDDVLPAGEFEGYGF